MTSLQPALVPRGGFFILRDARIEAPPGRGEVKIHDPIAMRFWRLVDKRCITLAGEQIGARGFGSSAAERDGPPRFMPGGLLLGRECQKKRPQRGRTSQGRLTVETARGRISRPDQPTTPHVSALFSFAHGVLILFRECQKKRPQCGG